MNEEICFNKSNVQKSICVSFDLVLTTTKKVKIASECCSFWTTSWCFGACLCFLSWRFLLAGVRFAFVVAVWRRWQHFEKAVQSALCRCCARLHDLLATTTNALFIELSIAAQIFHQSFLIGVFPLQLLKID